MNKLKIVISRLWGRDPETEEKIIKKREEAHNIVNQTMGDLLQVKKDVDETNIKTSEKLSQVSARLEDITTMIAKAQGAEKRIR